MFEARAVEPSPDRRQREIAAWFDEVYRQKGARYLRPPEAYRVFLDLLDVSTGMSILDVACGLGMMLQNARDAGLEVAGIDISPVAIGQASSLLPSATFAVASAETLPFPNRSFDRVTCLGSLERILHQDRALDEIARVLQSDGRLVLMVRNSHTFWWSLRVRLGLQNVRGHQGADTDASWRALLGASGFAVDAVYPDQWPCQRWFYWLHRLTGLPWTPAIRPSMLPLRFANEFIYVCSLRSSD